MRDEDWEISLKHLVLRDADGTIDTSTLRQLLNRLYDEIEDLKKTKQPKP
jgi:hypothetical protein